MFEPQTRRESLRVRYHIRDAIEFWDLTNRQDWDIVRGVAAVEASFGFSAFHDARSRTYNRRVVKTRAPVSPASRSSPLTTVDPAPKKR